MGGLYRQERRTACRHGDRPGTVHNATLGGARAFNRSDLGHLAPGTKADVVCIDLSQLHTAPVYDPIWALIHYATPTDIAQVFIDSTHLVEDGSIRGLDERRVLAEAGEPVRNRAGRSPTVRVPTGSPRPSP